MALLHDVLIEMRINADALATALFRVGERGAPRNGSFVHLNLRRPRAELVHDMAEMLGGRDQHVEDWLNRIESRIRDIIRSDPFQPFPENTRELETYIAGKLGVESPDALMMLLNTFYPGLFAELCQAWTKSRYGRNNPGAVNRPRLPRR